MEELLQHEELRNEDLCRYCARGVGGHARITSMISSLGCLKRWSCFLEGYRNTSSSLDEDFHIDSDCQNQNMDIKKEDLPKANKGCWSCLIDSTSYLSLHFLFLDASIFPSEKDKQSKPPHSLGSRSTSSSSIKSSDVQGANIRISVASMSTDSETSKKASAIERGLQRAALVEAALLRTKKVTLFFAKYCAGQVGKFVFRIHWKTIV